VGSYNKGNACVWCHKSRKDVTNYILPTNNNLSSTYWGPHEGPQSDIYTGQGGYHYAFQSYVSGSHAGFVNGCLDCHMVKVAANENIGNHTFDPQLSTCTAQCHIGITSFDTMVTNSNIPAGIQELRVILNNKGWLTRSTAAPYVALTATQLADKNYALDLTLPSSGLTADQAGAVYNYLLIARGSARGIHNPVYVKELLFDSIKSLTGSAPVSIPFRP
jgi:hypothetical protein